MTNLHSSAKKKRLRSDECGLDKENLQTLSKRSKAETNNRTVKIDSDKNKAKKSIKSTPQSKVHKPVVEKCEVKPVTPVVNSDVAMETESQDNQLEPVGTSHDNVGLTSSSSGDVLNSTFTFESAAATVTCEQLLPLCNISNTSESSTTSTSRKRKADVKVATNKNRKKKHTLSSGNYFFTYLIFYHVFCNSNLIIRWMHKQ